MEYKQYGPSVGGGGHLFWTRHYIDGSKKCVWVHRELMEQHLGRKLESWEHVHHKNENPTDNHIDNLEILTPGDHTRHHRPDPEMWPIVCPECGAEVEKQARQVRHNQVQQKKPGPFCGRSCAGRYNARKRIY